MDTVPKTTDPLRGWLLRNLRLQPHRQHERRVPRMRLAAERFASDAGW